MKVLVSNGKGKTNIQAKVVKELPQIKFKAYNLGLQLGFKPEDLKTVGVTDEQK